MPSYDYPRPAVTTDIILFKLDEGCAEVLLIERAHAPFEGSWALPGGFVDEGEDLEAAALRELQEETGISGVALEQLRTFGAPGRDPRGWTVSIAFVGEVKGDDVSPTPASDAREVRWFAIDDLPELAFDHAEILKIACEGL